MGVYFEPYERAEQFLSTYIMKKFFLVVTFLAAFHSPVLRVSGQDQEPPLSCDDLKKIDPNHEQLKVKCGDEDEELTRSFGFGTASSLHSGGNRNRNTQVIYDGQCNNWLIVGLNDCPIAFNFAPYEHLCEAGSWWRKQWIHTEPLYILKPRRGSYFCGHTPRFFCPILGESCGIGGGSHGSSSHVGSLGNTHGANHGSQWNNFPFHGSAGQNDHRDGHSQGWWPAGP